MEDDSSMAFDGPSRKTLGARKYARNHKRDSDPTRKPLRLQTSSSESMLEHAVAIAPQPSSADSVTTNHTNDYNNNDRAHKRKKSDFDPRKATHFRYTGKLSTDAMQLDALIAAGRSPLGIACMLHDERPEMGPKDVVRYLQKLQHRRGPKMTFADEIEEELFRREYYVDYIFVR